mmetsp:Transcript_25838/g.80501  ORF Transcript_25838/g.80501 Transcript_25838/m.80501 type:complete len:332 (+) Transcript_25838:226-1221(+)
MRFPVAALLLGSARATYVSDFQEFGYAVVEGFAAPSEVAAMKAEMKTLEAAYWASEEREKVVFRTDAGQEDAQASSRYFFESADRVHFFEEASGKALNKAGHGLHLTDGVFGAYSRSAKVRELLKALGYRRPALPQSMYIFKQPGVGGSVTSHQDATFLRTEPEQTVVGLWLALDDATVDNGCLWLRNRSHFEPLRRVFVRDRDPHEPDPNMVFVHTPPYRESNFFASYLADAGRRLDYAEIPWEGNDMTATQAAARGYIPAPARAGDLVVIAGTLDHLSLPNLSPSPRHTFQLHVVESDGVRWHPANWLQTERPGGFLALVDEPGGAGEL